MPRVVQTSVLLAVAAAAFGWLSVLLEGRPRVRRALGIVLLVAYGCGCARQTLVGRHAGEGLQVNLQLFWSYRAALMRVGGWLRVEHAALFEQIVLNYLLFVLLGCLLAFTWPRRYEDAGVARGLLRVALVAAVCSLCVELAQLVLRIGLFELDDVLDNALGAALGYLVYRVAGYVARRFRQGRTNAGRHQPRYLRR